MKHANIALFVPHIGCPNMCTFCNQNTISGTSCAPTPTDVTNTCAQAIEQMGQRAKQAEIAFFGGSFTAIDKTYMHSLLQAAYPFVKNGDVRGIRISTRPDAIDNDILQLLKSYGITTIELGAQSMNDSVLALVKRGHSVQDVRNASALILQHGFDLGLQMMLGLPGDTPDGAWQTAKAFVELGATQVRIYPTVVIAGTELARQFLAGDYKAITLEEGIDLAAELLEYFVQNSVSVIRLGLHASEDVEGEMLGGCYHPALREMCEGKLFLKAIVAQASSKNICVHVNEHDISKAVGQKKVNAKTLAEMGINCTFIQNSAVGQGKIKVYNLPG